MKVRTGQQVPFTRGAARWFPPQQFLTFVKVNCAEGDSHPVWSLTFMADGKKHIQLIPKYLVEEVQRLVEAGREYGDTLGEVMVANAQRKR